MAVLKTAKFKDLVVESFSFARIANYTEKELAYNCSLPGILCDRDISIETRAILIPQFGYDPPGAMTKIYETHEWCRAGHNWKVDLHPATLKCACGKMVHSDCASIKDKKIVCPSCSPFTRCSWSPGACVFEFPLPIAHSPSTVSTQIVSIGNPYVKPAATREPHVTPTNNRTGASFLTSKDISTTVAQISPTSDPGTKKQKVVGFNGNVQVQ